MAADNKSREIWNLTGEIQSLLESIQGDVKWTTDRYVDGIPIYQYTGEQLAKVNDAISDLDLHHRICTIWDPVAEPTEGNKKTSRPHIQTLPPPTPTIPRREPPRRPTTRSMTNATCHYNRRTRCIHCRGKHASEDHHLSLTIPPLPTLPARPTPRQHNPTPGPSTMMQGRSGAPSPTTTTRCCRCNPPKTKKRQPHSDSQCNRCI